MAIYYDQKFKTWYVKFKYKDWQGKTHATTKRGFKFKREAVAYEADYKMQAQQNPTLTIGKLVTEYLDDYKLNRKESSYRNIKRILELHVLPFFKDMQLGSIQPYHIKMWQQELKKGEYSDSSIKTYNVVFNTLLNYAMKYHGLPANPFKVTGTTGKITKSMGFWELSDFKRFDAVVDDPVYRVIFNLLFYSGLRIGELMALTVEDFDFRKNTVSVSKQYNDITGSITSPKSVAGIRTVSLPASIMAMVKDLFDRFYVIPERPFGYIGRKGIKFVMDRYAEKAKLRPIKIHDLRHSHVSMLIKQGINIAAISKRIGHASPAITLGIYSHVYKNDDEHIAEVLDNIREEKTSPI